MNRCFFWNREKNHDGTMKRYDLSDDAYFCITGVAEVCLYRIKEAKSLRI